MGGKVKEIISFSAGLYGSSHWDCLSLQLIYKSKTPCIIIILLQVTDTQLKALVIDKRQHCCTNDNMQLNVYWDATNTESLCTVHLG